MEIFTENANETKKFGREFSAFLKGGETICLSGDLGSGKTTFVQGLAKRFGIERIISPTFILMRTYKIDDKYQKGGIKYLYHLDLYRLEGNISEQLIDLGVDEIWEDPENVVLIEWAEKAKDVMPANVSWINFEYIDEKKRKIIINK